MIGLLCVFVCENHGNLQELSPSLSLSLSPSLPHSLSVFFPLTHTGVTTFFSLATKYCSTTTDRRQPTRFFCRSLPFVMISSGFLRGSTQVGHYNLSKRSKCLLVGLSFMVHYAISSVEIYSLVQ